MHVARVRTPAAAGFTPCCSRSRRPAAPCRENARRATGLGRADKWRLALHHQPCCCPRRRHVCCRHCAGIAGIWARSGDKAQADNQRRRRYAKYRHQVPLLSASAPGPRHEFRLNGPQMPANACKTRGVALGRRPVERPRWGARSRRTLAASKAVCASA